MGMRHGLLRALRSSLPLRSALNERPPDVQRPAILKTTSNPPIFLRKMAPFRCFARHKVTLACASAARMTFCRLSQNIKSGQDQPFVPAEMEIPSIIYCCAIKNRIRIGSITRMVAAISWFHWLVYIPLKKESPKDNVNFLLSYK